MSGHFEIQKGTSGQYHFNLKAGNGEVILTSETYTAKASAAIGIASVKLNAPHDAQYDRKTATDGSPFFVLKAANNEVIGKSEMYSGAGAMENGITSVKSHAPAATTKDLTGE